MTLTSTTTTNISCLIGPIKDIYWQEAKYLYTCIVEVRIMYSPSAYMLSNDTIKRKKNIFKSDFHIQFFF